MLDVGDSPLDDPWSSAPTRVGRHSGRLPLSVAAVVVGSSGTAIALMLQREADPTVAILLTTTAVAIEVCLGIRVLVARALGCVVVASTAALLCPPRSGPVSVAFVCASVLVAHFALSAGGRHPDGSRRAPVPSAPLALPVLIAAQVAWVRGSSTLTCAVILGAAAAVILVTSLRPDLTAPAERTLLRITRALSDAVGSLMLFAAAVPFLYLPGSISARFRRQRGWIPCDRDAVRDAGVPFITPPAHVRRRRHLTAAVSVLLIAAATTLVLRAETHTATVARSTAETGHDQTPDAKGNQLDFLDDVPYSRRPGLAGLPWADRLQADTRKVLLSSRDDVGYVTSDTTSEFVNVRDGMRRTIGTTCTGCPRVELWLAGGSTVFGIGQRDSGTIASELVRLAAADGVDLRVRNLGTVGWTLNQEVTDVVDRLGRTSTPPDGVVFLDGFNDAMAAAIRTFTGRPDDGGPLVLDPAAGIDVIRRGADGDPGAVDRAADTAVRAYRAEQSRIRAVLDPRGIRSWFFLQPDAFATRRQLAGVSTLYRDVPGIVDRPELAKVLDLTERNLGDSVVDLRHVFDDAPPVFIDVVHTGETGALLVARRLDMALHGWIREIAR